jgi:hypothetical protein
MTFKGKSLVSAIVLVGLISLAVPASLAASGGGGGGGDGGGGGGDGGSSSSSSSSSDGGGSSVASLDDKSLYTQGRDLAVNGKYIAALKLLKAIKHPDSMTYTMIGFAERKLGNYKLSLSYYSKALSLEPNNVNAHEYLGEAYVEQGMMDQAKGELAKVKALCGTGCEQYQDLSNAIKGIKEEG